MKKELTNAYLMKLKPPTDGREEISDTKRTGLRLRVYPARAVWMYEKRVKGGAKRKHTFGTYCTWSSTGRREDGALGLAEARALALEIEAEAARGFDRVLEAKQTRREQERAAATAQTLQDVLDAYDELHLSNLKRQGERKRQLEDALGKHLALPIGDLTRASLQRPIDDKAKEGKLFMANRIRAALKHFARWAWRREYLDQDIGDRLERATKEQIRERVLSLDEIRAIWRKTHELGDLWGPPVRLLILTVQRRTSINNLRKSELELSNARFKKAISQEKNDRGHITHLSPRALSEIEAVLSRQEQAKTEARKSKELGSTPVKAATSDLLFTTTGRTPISGWSKMKARLDELLGEDFEPWRLHDFRTAFATHMAERGISESVVDRVLNHAASASKASAVARVYNQAELLSQRAKALDQWADLVTETSSSKRVSRT
ncbi:MULTISPECIES: integrase family protein [unclassified Ruegeria]|uniref:tyrosine-type recombinase/integrase n=1 Tax=unclassified Ruegeria TaxID=2625375 RepID=UPI001490A596|nr:tyrosine-type recombinase/integrase [Ruegeria sp. HKCCD5849]NOD51973.1 tyrosine-type recombinase/integrase [Ruegeria sp. HKCCD5851]NOD66631.1 tyrosine-type recombinase/integrase [Ruegeria sp. HKCCD7303]